MNIIKKLFGLDKLEAAKAQAEAELRAIEAHAKELEEKTKQLEEEAKEKKEKIRKSKLTPKELATENGEPYFKVLDFQVNPENPRFGFFELDWNEHHVAYCKQMGFMGETDEDVVDRWFTEYCRQIANTQGVNMDRRATGFINVNNIGNGKTEVS